MRARKDEHSLVASFYPGGNGGGGLAQLLICSRLLLPADGHSVLQVGRGALGSC